jgi:hypothetical protein
MADGVTEPFASSRGALCSGMWSLSLQVLVVACLLLLLRGDKPPVPSASRPVELRLDRVVLIQNGPEPLFICHAVLVNKTGADLTVLSHYFSAFDGLDLVVEDERGIVLSHRSYLHHQSAASYEPRSFVLHPGLNAHELRIPVGNIGPARAGYQVWLLGTLPGSHEAEVLHSNKVIAEFLAR